MDNNLQSLLAQLQQYGMSGNARPASYTDFMPGPGSGELFHASPQPAASSGASADSQAPPPGAPAVPTGPIGKIASIFIPNTVRDINGMFGGHGKGGASAPAATPDQATPDYAEGI